VARVEIGNHESVWILFASVPLLGIGALFAFELRKRLLLWLYVGIVMLLVGVFASAVAATGSTWHVVVHEQDGSITDDRSVTLGWPRFEWPQTHTVLANQTGRELRIERYTFTEHGSDKAPIAPSVDEHIAPGETRELGHGIDYVGPLARPPSEIRVEHGHGPVDRYWLTWSY
jgi:hypothetical protein